MERTIEIAIDRTVESLTNPIENLQLMGRKEFQTQLTRLKNLYTKIMENARELAHLEEEGLLITKESQLIEYVTKCIQNGEFVLDIETTGLDPLNDIIVGICLYTPNIKPAYVPILHTDLDNKWIVGQLHVEIVRQQVQRLFDSNAKWINHNLKFDAKFIKYQWGIDCVPAIYWDTYIGAFLLNENEMSHALKFLYAKYITKSRDTQSYKELFDKTPFNYVPLDIAGIYGANDGYKTYKLYEFQKQYLNNDEREDFKQLYYIFNEIEMPLTKVLVDMELTGVEIRPEFAKELEEKYREKADLLLTDIYMTIDRFDKQIKEHPKLSDLLAKQAKNKKFKGTPYADKINFSSSTQKQILFYEILKYPRVNRKEPNSVGKDTIQAWEDSEKLTANQRKFLEQYVEWSKLDKLITSFIVKIPNAVDIKTNAVHTNFNQIGTVTGRFSSSHPIHKINLQQIPSKDKYVRKIFKAREGKVLVGSDFSQIEPRILASLSGDKRMIEAYTNGTDLYAMMASEIFKVPYEECLEFHPITGEKQPEGKNRRSQVKSVLLGIMYGRSPASIASQFGETKKWGEKIVEDFYNSFPEIRIITLKVQYMASKLGYVSTMCGRKRRLPNMKLSKDDYRYISACRQCLNAVIQGSSADIMKLAMISIARNERMNEIGAKPLITVHDELIIEVDRQYALEAGNLMSDLMKEVGERLTGLVMKCDVEISDIWTGDDITDEL